MKKNAEEKMGNVIPDIRSKIFLVSKTEDGTFEGTWKIVNQSLEKMKTDYLDLVHLHSQRMKPSHQSYPQHSWKKSHLLWIYICAVATPK